jgi:hypothetical protein
VLESWLPGKNKFEILNYIFEDITSWLADMLACFLAGCPAGVLAFWLAA